MVLLRDVTLLTAATLSLAACTSSSSTATTQPPPPPVATILAGNAQSATVGAAVAIAPAVQVLSTTGAPVSGDTVTFAVAGGGGSTTGSTQTTDASGTARLGSWVLGTTPGANSLTAMASGASGSPLTFSATATVGPPATISKQGGDAQSAVVGTPVATHPSVKVVDRFGNVVAGVPVVFAVSAGGGSVSGASQTTASDGTASIGGWTLGQLVGADALTATATGSGIAGNPVTFSATATVGALTQMTKVAGDAQTALSGTAVPTAPSVKLVDLFGNAIGGQGVTFSVTAGGGSVTGASPTSAANGIATLGGWTLGAAGANTLKATAGTLTATFTATAQAVLNAPQYAGTYSGSWNNTTYSTTGTGSAIVAVNTATSTATVTVNVTGTVLGTGNVPQVIRSGPYGATSASIANDTVPVMGVISATIDTAGNIVASGVHVPNAAIVRWDASGTITATTLQLNFTVTFASGPPASGNILLTRQ